MFTITIIVIKTYIKNDFRTCYTLFDANGKMYYTRTVQLALPNTIK